MLYKVILVSLLHRRNKSEILLIKRNREPEYGKWSLSGGTGALEKEADPKKAIFMEVLGDFSTNILDPKLFSIKYANFSEPTLHFYFEGELESEPKIQDMKTVKELGWFVPREILKMDIAFQDIDKEAVKQFMKNSK
jgi:ADP-ribose pyrophosphatase YjhB (NUDIX family)